MSRWLASPRAPWIAVAMGTLLTLAGLGNGLLIDDYFFRQVLVDGHGYMGHPRGPWELFTFFPDDPAIEKAAHQTGFWPWWMSGCTITFFRPISSLTHALDFTLWPDAHWAMHLHSTLWLGALLVLAALAYRRLAGPGLATGLAMAMFAFSEMKGFTVGWLATRNMLIATAFGLGCLIAHDRAEREGWGAGRLVAPLLLLGGLCSAEYGIGVLGYLVAYAAFLTRGSWRQRLATLAPYLLVIVGWQIAYKLMGYGARGSGLYLHPLSDPGRFVVAAMARGPVLALSQLTLHVCDLWVFVPAGKELVAGLGALVLVTPLTAYLFGPLLRQDARARFLGTGAVLALIPCCATFPHSRMLLLSSFGAFGLFGLLAATHLEQPLTRGRRGLLGTLATRHAVLGLLALPLTSMAPKDMAAIFDRIDATLPDDRTFGEQDLVVVNAPHAFFVMFLKVYREAGDRPYPPRLRVMGTAMADVRITRLDADSFRVETDGGYLEGRGHHLTWAPGQRRDAGYRVDLGDMVATVVEATPDGRPAAIRFDFRNPPESLRWVTWEGEGFVPFVLPAIGETRTLPAPDLTAVLQGAG